MIGHIITRWQKYLLQHKWRGHIFLGMLVLACLLQAAKLKIDAGWLTLFSSDNPVFQEYLSIPPIGSPVFYIHADSAQSDEWFRTFDGKIAAYPSHNDGWRGFTLTVNDKTSREDLISATRDKAERQDLKLTGGEVILSEFRDSVQKDILLSTFSAVVLITMLMLFVFRCVRTLIAAFFYQCSGIIIALGIYACFFDSLNLLSATVPCVLVGLGVDFSIHILYSWRQGYNANEIVSAIGRPMTLGALTTMAAFASLVFADLPGLQSMALLGAAGVFCCYAVAILFLPVTLENFHLRHATTEQAICNNTARWHGKFALPLAAILILVACVGIPKLEKENNLQNLYDPNLPALLAQKSMTEAMGHYTSILKVQAKTEQPEKLLNAVSENSHSWKLASAMSFDRGTLQLTLLAKSDPFNRQNLQQLDREFRQTVGNLGGDIKISGDAFLCNELDRRLVTGMSWAVAGMFTALLITIWGFKARQRFLILPVMAIALLAVGGCMGLADISINAYTITLLPLIIGIGIDDCFYILSSRGKNYRLCKHAVLMTTVTTVIGYGSLVFSANRGFAMAGKTATIGLFIAYVCAMILLNPNSQPSKPK